MIDREARKLHRIMIVTNDPGTPEFRSVIENVDYEIETISSVKEAAAAARRLHPHLILLDIDASASKGAEACREIRKQTAAPIVLLSPLGSEDDAIEAFASGADDYVVKPSGARLLAARISAVLRRARRAIPAPQEVVRIGGLSIDFDQRSVSRGGNAIALTPTEFRILEALVSNRGRVLANSELAKEIWGPTTQFDDHLLRVNISRLRKKVERDSTNPEVIVTRPRVGYLITRPE